MHISFITGNARKFSEAEALLGMSLAQVKLELPELQGLEPQEVMRHKLEAAKEAGIGPCIVEDSSLSFMCLGNKLPGPFIKWFEEALGIDGLVTLVEKYGDARATATTLVGYVDAAGSTHIFEGTLEGRIVPARGDQDFGYGPVFEPAGCAKTFGEMTREEKHAVSSRAIAFRKMKDYLEHVRA